MATRHPHELNWPDDKTLVALCIESGSQTAAARRLKVGVGTLHKRLRDRRLLEAVNKAKETPARKADPLPPPDAPETILREELKEARKALSLTRSEAVGESRVIDAIQRGIEARKPIYAPARRRKASRLDEHVFVLLWSDSHAGEVVDPAAVGGMNSYDWSIMLRRHRELFEAVASYVEHRNYPLARLHVAALGDALSGNIHDELRETNEMPLAEATVQFGLDAADWLEQFLELFPRIDFTAVYGNHARESHKKQSKRRYSNADRVCYQVMQQRLRRQNTIRFDVGKSTRQTVSIYGRTLLLAHGDEVGPSAMVGVPWGGIIRHVARVRNQYANMGLPIDHFLYGHFHEAQAVSAKRIIVNGSIVGANEWALEKFGECGPPEQVLLTFARKHGLVDISFLQLKAGLPT